MLLNNALPVDLLAAVLWRGTRVGLEKFRIPITLSKGVPAVAKVCRLSSFQVEDLGAAAPQKVCLA